MAVKLRLRHLLVALGFASLAGCQATSSGPGGGSILTGNVFDNFTSAYPATNSAQRGVVAGAGSADAPFAQNYGPMSSGLAAVGSTVEGDGENRYTLNYDNADVKTVIQAILGDALGLNYTISGNVSGPVTISSVRPVSRDDLLTTLETVLSTFGFSLSRQGESYIVSASGLRGGNVDGRGRTRPGYGVSIVPLRFVPVSTMTELIGGFVVESDDLRIDTTRNTVIVRGSGARRAEAVQAIMSFDADFMEDQSVSIFRLREARPEAVIPELERIFSAEGEDSLIHFRPVSRLRGIMAISKNAELLRRAQTWVERLDDQSPNAGEGVTVYKARYRNATELAKVMNDLFGGGVSQSVEVETDEGSEFGETSDAGEADVRVAAAFDGSLAAGIDEETDGAPGVIDLTTQASGGGSNVRISADNANNAVVVYAEADQANQIVAALRQLDSSPLQIAVNVTIAEVQLTDELRYGVQYFVKSNSLGLGDDNGSVSLLSQASNVLQSQIPGFNFILGSDADPDIIISALDVISDVEILSSPSLVVIENETATLQVGDEVPITTRQAQNVEDGLAPIINQVEFRDTGIILNVTPRVGQDDAVTMRVDQEISSVTGAANTLTPTISKRRVSSDISVGNGQTVLLAGLISSDSQNGRRGIPGLNRLPVVGELFSVNEKTANRTELVILIRPVVVRNAQDARSVADELRSQMWAIGGRQTPVKR